MCVGFFSRIRLRYVLSEPEPSKWNGEIGRMSDEIATSLFNSVSDSYATYCLVCGPSPFNELCQKTLTQVGYTEDCLHLFRG